MKDWKEIRQNNNKQCPYLVFLSMNQSIQLEKIIKIAKKNKAKLSLFTNYIIMQNQKT